MKMGIFVVIMLGIFFSKTIFCEEKICDKSEILERDGRWLVVAVENEIPDSFYCYEYIFDKNNHTSEFTVLFTDYSFYIQMVKSVSRAVLIPLQNCTFKMIRNDMLSDSCPTNISDFKKNVFENINEEENLAHQITLLDTDMKNWLLMKGLFFYYSRDPQLLLKSSLSIDQKIKLRDQVIKQLAQKYKRFKPVNLKLCEFFMNYCQNYTFQKQIGKNLKKYIEKHFFSINESPKHKHIFGYLRNRAGRQLVFFYAIVINILIGMFPYDF